MHNAILAICGVVRVTPPAEEEPRGERGRVEEAAWRGRRAKSFSTRSSRNSARQRPEHASSSSLSDVLHVLHAAATRTEGGDALLFSMAFSAGIACVAREA